MIAPLLLPLLSQGLNLLTNAAMAKGKDWLEAKTGVDIDSPLSKEDMLKLKQYEMDHEEELIKLQIEQDHISASLELARIADIENARGLQVEALKQDDLFVRRFIYYLATFWSIAAVIFIGSITFLKVPEANVRFADTILGFLLGTIISQTMTFFFGSSSSSHAKDEVIKNAVESSQ